MARCKQKQAHPKLSMFSIFTFLWNLEGVVYMMMRPTAFEVNAKNVYLDWAVESRNYLEYTIFCHFCSISVALQSLCFFSVFVSISSFFELLWLQKLRIYRTAQLVGTLAKNCFLQAFVFRCWLPEYVTYRKSKIDGTHKKISCKI